MANPSESAKNLVDALNARFNDYEFGISSGRRFDKVHHKCTKYGPNDISSVFCFVERETGGVFKAAGWKAPAAGMRYLIDADDSVEAIVSMADARKDGSYPSTGFLYVG